ncbi:ABC transporter permease [Silvibacterium dinghuense]|nr:ABC transporter permease [Silvibacterium dinghuense]GGG92268.1 hypothetical protein GCM10011586_03690 [Silvibacterium dinghuense]
MMADLKYAFRQLRKSPAFTLTAMLTLAIGIGANTAVFSMLDAMMLRPIAVPDLGRVMTLGGQQKGSDDARVSLADFLDWQRETRSFESMAIRQDREMNLTGAGSAVHVEAEAVSQEFFSLLQVQPLQGRLFRADESEPGRDGEIILSYRFWARQFGSDPGVVGRPVLLGGRNYTVVGVMPRSLAYPPEAELFIPLAPTPAQRTDRSDRRYFAVGRLRPGVALGVAQAEMRAAAERQAAQYPEADRGWSVTVEPLLKGINGPMTPLYLKMIMAATTFVLLIVCANVANLQFARGLSRRGEMALRTALGSSRWLLLRQLLAESLLLSIGGAAVGVLLAILDLHILLAEMPERIARYIAGWEQVSLNGRALVLSVVLAMAAGMISGLAPALEALRVDLVGQLKAGGRTTTGARSTHRLRSIFAVAQIALAVTLVIGSALMAKGMWSMLHKEDRLEPAKVLTFELWTPTGQSNDPARLAQQYEQSLDRLRGLPGVQAVALTSNVPDGNEGTWDQQLAIEGRPVAPGQVQIASRITVSPGFFDAMQVRLRSGRLLTQRDGIDTPLVAVVSRQFAEVHFPHESPLGHRVRLGENDPTPWVTIVGEVEDMQYEWIDPGPEPAIYLSVMQFPTASTRYVLRTAGDAPALASAARAAIAGIDPTFAISGMESYAGYLHDALIGLLYAAGTLVLDAGIALLLAALGIFGVMASVVGERRKEVGLRLLLGATRGDVTRMFLRRAGMLTAVGMGVGVVAAAGLARAVASLLFGVRPDDVAVFGAALSAIALLALGASWIPVHTASRIEPVTALRDE